MLIQLILAAGITITPKFPGYKFPEPVPFDSPVVIISAGHELLQLYPSGDYRCIKKATAKDLAYLRDLNSIYIYLYAVLCGHKLK